MAAVVEYARDASIQINSSGTTVVREKQINANSMDEIVNAHLLPQYGSRHPVFTHLRMTDCSFTPTGNTNGKVQGVCSATYSSKSTSMSLSSDKEPWELGAQNLTSQSFSYQVPLLEGYAFEGSNYVKKQLMNTAGCRIEATTEKYGTDYNFVYAVRKKPSFPNKPIINYKSATIAGMTFDFGEVMLMPVLFNPIIDRDDNGNVLRSYWEVNVNFRHKDERWFSRFLNVGTLARHSARNLAPQPTYKYFSWSEYYDEDNPDKKFEAPASFGNLIAVLAAKEAYAYRVSPNKNSKEWLQAYNELPYEEVTEPLPLNELGMIDLPAMIDPENNPYRTIGLYEYPLWRFAALDLPKKLED